jgi:DNA-directed RNA polymerase specialized sigma24 family protein
MTSDVKKYIEKRYDRYLDYATYHCGCAGIADESEDVLQESLVQLFEKPSEKLQSLYDRQSGQYREIDYFLLRIIKMNATSDTAPYRAKYKPIPRNENVCYTQLDIEDVVDDERDYPAETLEKMNKVREALEELNLSERAKAIFHFRFFCGEQFKNWQGEESEKELFDVFYKVQKLIKERINGKSTLF